MYAKLSLLFFLAAFAQSTIAEVPLYGQCGGSGYTGGTVCVSGAVCIKLNEWYCQCQPGSATLPGTTTTSTVSTVTTTTTVIPTTPTGPVTVLPLGDSITFGIGSNEGNSYRKDLKDRLLQDNITINYIGTVKNGNMQDNDNQGHSGATIIQISGYADTALAQKPQVVTLMAGTNDIGQNSDLANAPNRLMTLIDKIFTASPNAAVLVASLVPLPFNNNQANVDTYNTRIEALVQARISAGQHVVWASMAGLTTSDLADGIHPNASGYVKMGAAWYSGWVTAAQKGWII